MPKDRRVNSPTFDRAKVSPYACSLKIADRNNSESCLPLVGDKREWEEIRCPICMEHPHNAVMLLCSSRERGCCPFMCDTSYRHSNCLDQFLKSSPLVSSSTALQEQESELICPLCRGQITGLIVKEPARKFMNFKSRSCSLETCEFSGTYAELRNHARLKHPSVTPSIPSPTRQSNWAMMERQRDIDDALAHQLDFESEWDGWPNWEELGDADFWSDGSFWDGSLFDFPIEEMSDFEDEVIGSLPLSYSSLYSSFSDMINSNFTGSDTQQRSSTPTPSNPMSNNHGGEPLVATRSTLHYHRQPDSTISELRSRSYQENLRSSYQMDSSASSRRRSSVNEEQTSDPTISGSRSRSHHENSRSNNQMENSSASSRRRSSDNEDHIFFL